MAQRASKNKRGVSSQQAALPGLEFKKLLSFGGSLLKRSHAKDARPLSSKQALHIVLRSDHATGRRSMLSQERVIQNTLKKIGSKHGVKIYRVANAGNHLHLLVRFTQRRGLQNFLRGACGIIARKMTGAERGKAVRPQLAMKEALAGSQEISLQAEGATRAEHQRAMERIYGDVKLESLNNAGKPERASKQNRNPTHILTRLDRQRLAAQSSSTKHISYPAKGKSPQLKFTLDAGRFWTQRPFTRIVSWGRDFDSVLDYLKLNTLEALGFISRKHAHALPSQAIRSRVLAQISLAFGYG